MGINPILSDLKGPGTSKLDWRYLEHNKNDRNELQIRSNAQKGAGTKISAIVLTQTPLDDWPDALDHL